MEKILETLLAECESYMNDEKDAKTEHQIVNDVVDLLKDKDLADYEGLNDYLDRAMILANYWIDDLTISEYADMFSEYVEELCGFLAEKLA